MTSGLKVVTAPHLPDGKVRLSADELLGGFASAICVLTSAADLGFVFRGFAVTAAILAVGCGLAIARRMRTLVFAVFLH